MGEGVLSAVAQEKNGETLEIITMAFFTISRASRHRQQYKY